MRRRELIMGGLGLGITASGAGGWLALRQANSESGSLISSSPPTGSPVPTPVPSSTPTTIAVEGLSQPLYLPPRRDERLLVISDLNTVYGSTVYDPEIDRAFQLVSYWDPDIVISGGDMVAGQSPSL
ncbi:MAG: metallophosphoesterase, partial [Cyanophyceae cyanobacterium]